MASPTSTTLNRADLVAAHLEGGEILARKLASRAGFNFTPLETGPVITPKLEPIETGH